MKSRSKTVSRRDGAGKPARRTGKNAMQTTRKARPPQNAYALQGRTPESIMTDADKAGRRRRFLGIALAALLACAMISALATTSSTQEPLAAYAASKTFFAYDGNANTNEGVMYESTDGLKAYCADQYALGPADKEDGGSGYSQMTSSPKWDYLMYHGYPHTNTIEGTTWSDLDASDITQLAAWFVNDRSWTTTADVKAGVLAAAEKLADQALAYKGGGVEDGWSTLWEPSNEALQVMLACTEWGSLSIRKTDAQASLTSANPCYSLKGAQYGLYRDQACSKLACTLTTAADGSASSPDLVAGSYWIKEIKAPSGYATDNTAHKVTLGGCTTTKLAGGTLSDEPLRAKIELLLTKHDENLGDGGDAGSSAQGAASLEGALFSIDFYGGLYDSVAAAEASGSPLRSWVVQTDPQGLVRLSEPGATFTSTSGDTLPYLVSGDALFSVGGTTVMPLGTCVIRETAAPKGYLLPNNESPRLVKVEPSGTAATGAFYQPPTFTDRVKRGDIEFIKICAATMKRLAGVPFKLTSQSTGESHVIVTDANGQASTAASRNKHSSSTNANDQASASTYDCDAGIWFSGTANGDAGAPVDDSRGALPYDVYTLEELPCPANEGLDLISIRDIAIAKDSVSVQLGTLSDNWPVIGTLALDASDGDKIIASKGEASVIDRVAYLNLIPGKEYTVSGSLMDAQTGEPLTAPLAAPSDDAAKEDDTSEGASKDTSNEDADTSDNTSENEAAPREEQAITAEVIFTPDSPSGTVELLFPLPDDREEGQAIVVFEKLSRDGRTLATHEDLEDTDQTVHVEQPEEPAEPEEPETPEEPAPEEPEAPQPEEENPVPEEKTPEKKGIANIIPPTGDTVAALIPLVVTIAIIAATAAAAVTAIRRRR